jgi:MYXO-CTERM domain-containing protein
MKRIAWILLAGALLVGAAQAAYIEMNAPDTLTVGQTLEVTGNSLGTLKPGFSTDLIFYRIAFTKTEIARTRIVVQQGGVFSASFPTAGLSAGTYLLELVDPKPEGSDVFGGDAKTQKQITLIDRQDEITITSPLTQPFTGRLSIRGSISTAGNNGTQLSVDHNGMIVYGPVYIATLNDAFSTDIPITEGGTYTASFSDAKSYIGLAQFTVSQPVQTTVVTTTAPPAQQVSASAQASRNQPAYFEVDTKPGTITMSTSSGIDWVMEYIDEDNQLTVVNEKGTIGGETVAFAARGGRVYVEVYPFTFSDQGTVTLTATNADSVSVCTGCVSLFATTPPTTTQKSPLPAFLALVALAVLLLARRR